MKLGLDFDNTLINYDPLIRAVAIERGLLGPASLLSTKQAIRDAIRQSSDGDLRWQQIQSYIYSQGVQRAVTADGLELLFDFVRNNAVETWIVSHKTTTAPFDLEQRNLRTAALDWMEEHGFFDPKKFGLDRDRVVFADTKEQKIEIIRELGLTVFVDDLPEILVHPRFPHATRRILYSSTAPSGFAFDHLNSWAEITDSLALNLSSEKMQRAISHLGSGAVTSTPVRGGRNSRCFRVTPIGAPDQHVFLKQYFRSTTDPRDRLATEYRAIEFMRSNGIRCIPAPKFCDRETYSAGYGFVEGVQALRTEITEPDIDALLDFLRQLHSLRTSPESRTLGAASEACFSLEEIAQNLEKRFARLTLVCDLELQDFLQTLAPVIRETLADTARAFSEFGSSATCELAAECRTLSPSDIGFHNTLRLTDGKLVFIDFEYFGWDDPAKLISDFLLQPEQTISEELRARFLEGALALYGDRSLSRRLELYLPLFRLKWTAILLNEFLRNDGGRRAFAAAHGGDARTILDAQLTKARRIAQPLLQSTQALAPLS